MACFRSLLLLGVLLLCACDEPLTLEQQVIATMRNMEAHVEARERRAFMAYVAEDFEGQDGEFNKDQLNGLLLYYLRRYAQLNAQLLPVKVESRGEDLAEATFQVLLTGGEGVLPQSGQLVDVSSSWKRKDGEWLLQTARWTPLRMGPN
jgi:hypothetical protein